MANYFNLRKFANDENGANNTDSDKNSKQNREKRLDRIREKRYEKHKRMIDSLVIGDTVRFMVWGYVGMFIDALRNIQYGVIVSITPKEEEGRKYKEFEIKIPNTRWNNIKVPEDNIMGRSEPGIYF